MKERSIPTLLFVLSLLSVVVLLSITDFSAHESTDFGDIPHGERVRLISALVGWEKTEKGWILSLQDVYGNSMDAFYRGHLDKSELYQGKVIETVGRLSDDSDHFFFIEMISQPSKQTDVSSYDQ